MVEVKGTLSRRQTFRKKSFSSRSSDRDDRGWTPLHIGARKGDLKEVIWVFFSLHASFLFPALTLSSSRFFSCHS